ncbi:hypothetical protein [Streptomyces sp. NPDC001903]
MGSAADHGEAGHGETGHGGADRAVVPVRQDLSIPRAMAPAITAPIAMMM